VRCLRAGADREETSDACRQQRDEGA